MCLAECLKNGIKVKKPLFHVQEHRFTWLDIKKMIDKAGLKLVSVLIDPGSRNRYQERYDDDPVMLSLKNWHEFEVQNPITFRNMYYFWVAHKEDRKTAQTSPAIWATNLILTEEPNKNYSLSIDLNLSHNR